MPNVPCPLAFEALKLSPEALPGIAALPCTCGRASVETVGRLDVLPVCPPRHALSPASPSLQWVAWASLPHPRRYYAQLRLPSAPLGSLHLSLASRYLVCSLRLCPAVRFADSRKRAARARALGQPDPCSSGVCDKEAAGSPKFPGSPCECMPRSTTPVESVVLALARLGLLPPAPLTASALAYFPCGQ